MNFEFQVGDRFTIDNNIVGYADSTVYTIHSINRKKGHLYVSWFSDTGDLEKVIYSLKIVNEYFKDGSWILDIKFNRREKLKKINNL